EGIMNRLFPAMPEEAFKTYLEQYEQLHDSICPAPFSGIRELMSALVEKGFHLAMVTGKSRQATDITLKKFGLLPFFELIETGSPEKASKVNKLTNVLHHFNINPSEALYIGDEARDIDYCRKANIAIASAAWASTAQLLELEQQNPGMVFKQLESFKDWLFKQ
ncbi:MAG: HAD hydrolase-like protein, partial [Bacteroidota bacterium]|nr:HAD hydrolase-like protein [Bacteroidota bacterium]